MMQFGTHLLVIIFLGLSASVGHARSLQISGTAGYLAEWEFRRELKETESGKEVSGRLAWKHIGLCSVNGPQEQPGEISARISGWGFAFRNSIEFFDTGQRAGGNRVPTTHSIPTILRGCASTAKS